MPFTLKQLEADLDLQDIISINIKRAVQQAVDIASMILSYSSISLPGEMTEVFSGLRTLGWISPHTEIQMKKFADFRNLAVHEYEKIDWKIVFAIATKHLEDFKQFAREVTAKSSAKK